MRAGAPGDIQAGDKNADQADRRGAGLAKSADGKPAHPAQHPDRQHQVPQVVFERVVGLVRHMPLLDALQLVEGHGDLPDNGKITVSYE